MLHAASLLAHQIVSGSLILAFGPGVIVAHGDADRRDKPAGILVRAADQFPEKDCILLQTVARVVISDGDGSLAQQLERRRATPTSTPTPAADRGENPRRTLLKPLDRVS